MESVIAARNDCVSFRGQSPNIGMLLIAKVLLPRHERENLRARLFLKSIKISPAAFSWAASKSVW